MGKSARILGEQYGLTAQEMNQLLKNEGFLEGYPGAYSLTEKGAQYATEKDNHRGPGGHPCYNRDWTTRTWDNSIEEALHISPGQKRVAREGVAEMRRQQAAALQAAREEADRNFRATGSAYISPDDIEEPDDTKISGTHIGKGAGVGLIFVAGCYGIYKAAPHVKRWWNEKAKPWLFGSKGHENQNR